MLRRALQTGLLPPPQGALLQEQLSKAKCAVSQKGGWWNLSENNFFPGACLVDQATSSNSELPFELVYQETGGWRRLLKRRTRMASAGRAKDEEAEVADAFRKLFLSTGLCLLSRILHNGAWAAGSYFCIKMSLHNTI